ncbi:YbaB/EbfC family nucleoid-associated protein [Streptomyces sp. NPDC001380]|uniref:YbaB/EbfC family nucleoid-associated protein n=1 Tax=Streptomyces sp. NPDC001380 TaxID=3364566 RepID=UPI0036AF9C33
MDRKDAASPQGMADLTSLLEQTRQVQEDLVNAQQDLAGATVDGHAGNGLVRALVSGTGELQDLEMSDQVFSLGDPAELAALVLAAVRDAQTKVTRLQQEMLSPLSRLLDGMDGAS